MRAGTLFGRLLLTHLLAAVAAALIGAGLTGRLAVPAVVLGVAGVAVAAALLAARPIAASLRGLAASLRRLAAAPGPDREAEALVAEPSGPAEVRELAAAVERARESVAAALGELRREAAVREQILSAMSEGVLLAEASGRIAYANPAALELLGAARVLPPQTQTSRVTEFSVHHPRHRELQAVSVDFEEGRRLVVVQDVTEFRRLDSMRRDFVANASHELKTPVSAILAAAETLETAAVEDSPSVPRFVGALAREARRLSRLVQELLDLARIEQEAPPEAAVYLTELVRGEAERIRQWSTEKGLAFTADIAEGVVVRGRGDDLALAVRNLLDNAVRYTSRGRISLRLAVEDGRAVVEVTDTGTGMPEKDLPRIFERFYRVDLARSRATGGTGLGLSIVRHVVEGHGGEVRVESRLGRGSRFIVSLPHGAG